MPRFNIVAIIIIVSAVVLAVDSVWNDSPIVDEIPHIGAGYSYAVKGDYRLNPEHPPLAKDLAGLALLPLNLNQAAFQTQFWTQDINGQWNFGRNLIFNSGNDAVKLVRAAKMPMLLFFVMAAILVFYWASKLYGGKAGILALFLFSFSPTVIAHSRFVTTDTPALFGILFASYFFVGFLKNKTKANFLLAAAAFGTAQLTKFSAFLLVPFFVILAMAWALTEKEKILNLAKHIFLAAAVFMAGFGLIVWPVYALHTRNYPPEKQKYDTTNHLLSYGNRSFAAPVVWASDKPFLRPLAQYGLGLLMVAQRSIGGNDTYFLGEVRNVAWKKYFPIVYFMKEPLPFWGFVIIAVTAIIAKVKNRKLKIESAGYWIKNHFDEFAMILWLAIYWYSSLRANLNIGVRHLLPIYGFVYILVAGQIIKIVQSRKLKVESKKFLYTFYFTLFTLLGWYLVENIRVYPYYLTYFNQVALLRPSWASEGQVGHIPGGHWYVVDSNIDWGQDLKRLGDWVNKNNISKINFDYFGWADPYYYLKDKYVWMSAGKYKSAEDFLKEYPDGGHIAVSATFFMGTINKPDQNYIWLLGRKPAAIIGNSIFVWKINPSL